MVTEIIKFYTRTEKKKTGVKRKRLRAQEPFEIGALVETRMYRGNDWAHHRRCIDFLQVVNEHSDASCDVIFQDGVKRASRASSSFMGMEEGEF